MGRIATQVVIDSKQAEIVLKRLDALTKLAEYSLSDLSNIAKTLGESMTISSDNANAFAQGLNEVATATEQADKVNKTYRQRIKEELREDRFRNRIARETRESIMGLAFAFSFLSGSIGDGGEKFKGFEKGLISGIFAMNAADFALFNLGASLEKAGGKFAGIGTFIGKYSNWIALAIGATVALTSAVSGFNDRLKKVNEQGIKNFTDELAKLGGTSPRFLKAALQQFDEFVIKMNEAKRMAGFISYGGKGSEGFQQFAQADITGQMARAGINQQLATELNYRKEIVQKIKDQIEEQSILLDYHKKVNEIILKNGNQYEVNRIKIEELTDQIEHFDKASLQTVEGAKKYQELIDQRAKLQKEINESQKTTDEKQADLVTKAKTEYELKKITTSQYLEILKTAHALTEDSKLRLAYESAISSLMDKELENFFALTREYEASGESEKELIKTLQSLRMENVTDEFERRKKAEEEDYKREIELIKARGVQAGELIEGEYTGKSGQALKNREELHQRRINQIELDRAMMIGKLRIDTIAKEKDQIIEKYKLEEFYQNQLFELSNKNDTEKQIHTLALAGIQMKKEKEIHALKMRNLDEYIEGIESIGEILNRAFGDRGNESMQKFFAALQSFMNTIRAFIKITESKEGGSIGDIFSLITNVLGFIAIGAQSGAIAKRGQPFIVGESGRELFIPSTPGVIIPNENTENLIDISRKGFALQSVQYFADNNGVIDELKRLRTDVQGLQLRNEVVLKEARDWQILLRRQMPNYKTWERKKYR